MFQRDTENWYKFEFEGVGRYGIPALHPEQIEINRFIPFNYAKGCRDPDEIGVHFFLHDYQFRRIWDMPERYMQMLRRFSCVCTPDYSLYMDMPKAMQIYNHYKKQWMGAYWQAWGLSVIPTVSWSDEDSFSWCFEGVPKRGAVAVSSVGCMKNKKTRQYFLQGYHAMIDIIQPKQIFFYGAVPEEIDEAVIRVETFQERFKKVKEGDLWVDEAEVVEKLRNLVV